MRTLHAPSELGLIFWILSDRYNRELKSHPFQFPSWELILHFSFWLCLNCAMNYGYDACRYKSFFIFFLHEKAAVSIKPI